MNISFKGPVRFYNNERRANILLKQFQSDKEVKIGEFNSIENKLMFESGNPMKWVNDEHFNRKTLNFLSNWWLVLFLFRLVDHRQKIKRFELLNTAKWILRFMQF